MALRLVSSGNDQALVIRDHLVRVVHEQGAVEVQRDAVRLTVLRTGSLAVEHWTPFNDPSASDAASPGYRHALAHQHTVADLPYGLDVSQSDHRVLRVLWADSGVFKVVDFVRGAWEAEALVL